MPSNYLYSTYMAKSHPIYIFKKGKTLEIFGCCFLDPVCRLLWELYNVVNNNRRKSKTIDKQDWLIFFVLDVYFVRTVPYWVLYDVASCIQQTCVFCYWQRTKTKMTICCQKGKEGKWFDLFDIYVVLFCTSLRVSSIQQTRVFCSGEKKKKNKYLLPAGRISLAFWYIWGRSISS